jgi:hypothetical protein
VHPVRTHRRPQRRGRAIRITFAIALILGGALAVTAFKGRDTPVAAGDPTALSVAAECRQALGYQARTPEDLAWLQKCVHALTAPTVSSTGAPSSAPSAPPPATPSTSPTSPSTSPPKVPSGPCPVAGKDVPGAADPWGGCWPGPGTTGVSAGTVLHTCATTVTASGTYDSCQFNGAVSVTAPNVTIARSRINGPVDVRSTGLVISDTTLACGCPSTSDNATPTAIMGSNFTLLRVDLSGSGHGVATDDHVVIQDTWIHGLGGNTQAHKDGVYVGNGTDVKIQHSAIDCNDGSARGCTSAIGLLTDFGTINHYTITRNLLNSIGSYCFYAAGGPSKPYGSEYITFTENIFGRADNAKCGFYGPVTYWNSSEPGMVWSSNRFSDGTVVNPVY